MATNFFPTDGTIRIALTNEFGLALLAEGTAANLPTGAGYALGCEYIATDTGVHYFNTGTTAAAAFTFSSTNQTMQVIQVNQTAAQMIATTAGSLSHANGLIVVPAAPTGFVNVFHRGIVSYTFATAAFTGGGNTTFNIGGGGAALTGLIATTTLWQNASSIIQHFVPLSTVAFPITKETSINLVTASAITNPGTAAGSAKVYVWYSQVAI